MAQVALDINGRRYEMACDDGQEERLRRVGHFLDQRVRALARQVGPVGENRLLLMAALMVSDEMLDVAENPNARGDLAKGFPESSEQAKIADVLDGVAERIERIAAHLEAS